MPRQADDNDVDRTPEESRQGFKGADILAVLAVSTFLAAVGLAAFFLATAFGS